ncbi:GyrI-like domain-containing protein [Sporosarcina thermotolerans]|uniref:GyrI-like domain-containing protein n=1 Tax=Sporosarcina thermotolerans TaxID=633404 RepID=A0AAW9A560_9BACL|nr:GyrI-like domain-containing protein [Sporosarcina thermotolerans]MDW0116004.1 GyrI-like domain-containing protein [Sporosarcina thermotolerans]WHT49810.1 GyrI-like domain-containing protein [Sporosarcina thermotolerans]
MQNFQYEIVEIPAYRAIGYKWDGPYTEVSSLKEIIYSMSSGVSELEHAINPEVQLGLSYHLRPDGFVHYSVYEVSEEQQIPEGMVEIYIPEMTYLMIHHKKEHIIGQSYDNIFQWLKESKYEPLREDDVEYFDRLPIKHERYPNDRDVNNPHFDILIPISKRA